MSIKSACLLADRRRLRDSKKQVDLYGKFCRTFRVSESEAGEEAIFRSDGKSV
jgi:hypothetical protein